ncbi:MAG: hypothetical protein WD556_06305 [Actinomycetota bacterium]
MTSTSARDLEQTLRELGLTSEAIAAAWPGWWSDEAESSPSARAELRFGIARRLGLEPASLLEGRDPQFAWQEEARFKHSSAETDLERAALASFGMSVASLALSVTPGERNLLAGRGAPELRNLLLGTDQPFVGLSELLSLAWSVGIPVLHLRVFPWPQKKMAGMSATIGDRSAVLLARDSNYPASPSFFIAHELGHIALGHMTNGDAIVDLDDQATQSVAHADREEAEADAFALELLTGDSRPRVLPHAESATPTARGLAQEAIRVGRDRRIEPGVLAQAYGYTTGDWRTASGSLRFVYSAASPIWQVINRIAWGQMSSSELPLDPKKFLESVLGEPDT